MVKALKSPSVIAALMVCAVLAVNAASGHYGGYPFLYCWLVGPVANLYIPWAKVVLIGAFLVTAIGLYRLDVSMVFKGFVAMVVVTESPRLCNYLLNTGGACG